MSVQKQQVFTQRITPDQINSRLTEEEAEVSARIGKPLSDPEAAAFYEGELAHRVLLGLGQKAEVRYAALQKKMWEVYSQQTYKLIRISVTNPDGTSIVNDDGDIQYHRFTEFDEYFAYLCSEECLDIGGSQKSGLYNGTTKLLALVGQGRLLDEVTGQPYTVDDVLCMPSQTQQTLAGVALRALKPGTENPDNVQTALNIARASNSHEELMQGLQEAGLTNRDETFPVFYFDTGEDVLVAGRISYADLKRLTVGLRNRADLQLTTKQGILIELGVEVDDGTAGSSN